MQRIGSVASRAVEKQPESSQNEWQGTPQASRGKARVARVFAYFRAWFPHFQADDLMVESWAQETAHLSDAEFKTGLDRTKQAGLQHPPSLPKWLELCKPETGSPRYLGADPVSYTEQRVKGLLPQPPKAVRDMSALRAALRAK